MKSIESRLGRKAVWGSGVTLALVLSSVLFSGCGKADQGRGPAVLVLDSLMGASGAEPEKFGVPLASDVLTLVKAGTDKVPTIFEDPGQAKFHVVMKDIESPVSPNNSITLTRYHVTFIRSDGRNTPGVDVPYGFDGAATITVSNAQSTLGFTLVRASSKTEMPLRALVGAGGSQFINTIAQVTFYGTDAAGNAVSVTGQISINFADWGDPV